jgi:predicted  nucleic acid-binding Zn-ribbon protein
MGVGVEGRERDLQQRSDVITQRLVELETELASVRSRMEDALSSPSDAPGADVLLASVFEKLGGPPAGMEAPPAGTPTLGQVQALEQERDDLEAEQAQVREALAQAKTGQ